MSVDGSVSSCSGKTFIFFIRDVFSVFLDVPFGKSEIDDVNFMRSRLNVNMKKPLPLADADYEIVRFDVSMEEMP